MTAVTDRVQELLGTRLTEIDEEKGRVERAIQALSNGSSPAPATRRSSVPRRRGRKGGRAPQALAMIEAKPGITASEIAGQMKIKPNYLYRLLGDLEKRGLVTKDGRRYTLA